LRGDLGPHPTQCGRGRRLPARQCFILIRPQYTNVADRQDMTDRQTDRHRTYNGPIAQGEPFHKRSPNMHCTLRSLTTDILATFYSLDSHIFIVGLFFTLADIFQSILVSSEYTSTSRQYADIFTQSWTGA